MVETATLEDRMRLARLAEEVARVGYWRIDCDTATITWSAQMFRMAGGDPSRAPEDLASAMAMIHPDDRRAADERVARAREAGEGWNAVPVRVIDADGVVRHLSSSAICERDDAGRVTAIFGTNVDVTKEAMAVAALRESEARFRFLAERATDTISRTGLDGRMIYLSPSAERMSGYRNDELLGRSIFPLVHPDDRADFIATHIAIMEGRRPSGVTFEYRFKHKSGAWIWLEGNPCLFRDAAGAPVEFIDVQRDITARKQMEAEQQHANETAMAAMGEKARAAQEAKTRLLANVGHELRTPLNAILNYGEMIAETAQGLPDQVGESAQLSQDVKRVLDAAASLQQIIQNLLSVARTEPNRWPIQIAPVELTTLIEGLVDKVRPRAATNGNAVVTSMDTEIGTIGTDSALLGQCIENVLANATKFTRNGHIRIAAKRITGTDPSVEIIVSDTGIGIAHENHARIFEPFFKADDSTTRAFGGTGLGLAISRQLIESLGGRIAVSSKLNEGAAFTLTLPLQAPLVASAAA